MGREGRDYWEEQLSEYWDSGLTIQEYSELKERGAIVRILGQRLDDSRIQRTEGTSLRKYTPLDPSVGKGTPGWSDRFGIAGAGRGQTIADRCKEWFRDSVAG